MIRRGSLDSESLSQTSALTQIGAAGAQLWNCKWILVCLSFVSDLFSILVSTWIVEQRPSRCIVETCPLPLFIC